MRVALVAAATMPLAIAAAAMGALATVAAATMPLAIAAAAIGATPVTVCAQADPDPSGADAVPRVERMRTEPASAMRDPVERFTADRRALFRRYTVPYAADRRERMREFYREWREELAEADFEGFGVEGRVDSVLLDRRLRYELALLEREEREAEEMARVLPFAPALRDLERARRDMEDVDGREAARVLVDAVDAIGGARESLEASAAGERPGAFVAYRAARAVDDLREVLDRWNRAYSGYDPEFTWWVERPHAAADSALESYAGWLRREIVGVRPGETDPIVGDPIGAEGLAADLAVEMIPYTPAELIAVAERELAWCHDRMREAAREMGYGDDWQAALEHVKTLHVEPGEQPRVIRELALEAIRFMEEHDLVTVPDLAEEVWRIDMMSPERQRVSPFFLGGETILVSYPTDAMSHEEKLMSMRGNNPHFSKATVHHELIPGHHLQGFMNERFNSHRRLFRTPFWHEGNALYWEFRLWDLGFPESPEDRMGFLFWRSHRAARIIFSLGFHLGRMTPEEAIDFLVEEVGHERANAEAEVRRSFAGDYSPLYQAAYMLGGLQFYALHEEFVESGRMSEREFHDFILRGGPMPVEMVRVRLLGEEIGPDYEASWRFTRVPG